MKHADVFMLCLYKVMDVINKGPVHHLKLNTIFSHIIHIQKTTTYFATMFCFSLQKIKNNYIAFYRNKYIST